MPVSTATGYTLSTYSKLHASGDLIEGTGGLRKLRFADPRRGKGKRGKDEMADLSARQRTVLKQRLSAELNMRRKA